MKKLLFLGALLLALTGWARAQEAPTDIVVVRVRDYKTSAVVFITRGEGKTERVEIDVKGSGLDKGMIAVSEGYYGVMQKLYREGYILHNSTGISDQTGGGVITYLFVKKLAPASR